VTERQKATLKQGCPLADRRFAPISRWKANSILGSLLAYEDKAKETVYFVLLFGLITPLLQVTESHFLQAYLSNSKT
jgi:hypothetical protein